MERLPRASSREELAALAEAAAERGWAGAVVSLAAASGKRSFLEAWDAALPFPTWFGWNWDAFADVADAVPDGADGLFVGVTGWAGFAAVAPEDAAMAEIVLASLCGRNPAFRVVLV